MKTTINVNWMRGGVKVIVLAVVLLLLLARGAGAAPAATCTWNGSVDSNWAMGGNWTGCTGGGVPAVADNVLLDNSIVSGNFAVILPSGAITTTINRLTITPGAGKAITLTLPATNASSVGFNVGDNIASTDDIILDNGALLVNSSGASAGNGIQANSTANGTVRINNGGRYLHNTARSTAGVVPLLSIVAGTETGIFEYDSPGIGSVSISASGRTYGSLTLTRTAGAATYTSSGGSALTVRGNFLINTGVTYNTTMSGGMNVGGNWTNSGTFTGITSTVTFNGSAAQTLGGSTVTPFATLTISNTGVGVTMGNAITVSTQLSLTSDLTTTGSYTVNLTSTAICHAASKGDVVGFTQRQHAFTVGTAYCFGNPNVTLNFSSTGTIPTDATVFMTKTVAAGTGFTNAVQRIYSIAQTGGSGFSATLRLHYLDAELNGNTEGLLSLWSYDTPGPWIQHAASAFDSTANWVESSGLSQFSSWVISQNGPATPTAVSVSTFNARNLAPSDWTPLLALLGLAVLGATAVWGARRWRN